MQSPKTAIIFVHGQGDQSPMDGARDLAFSTWRTDPELSFTPDGPLKYWAIQTGDEESYDLRRLTTEPLNGKPGGRRYDYFEFYWAHLMPPTTFGSFRSWFARLLGRDPKSIPNVLLRIRQLVLHGLEMSIALLLTACSMCLLFFAPTTGSIVLVDITRVLGIAIMVSAVPLIAAYSLVGDYLRSRPKRYGSLELLSQIHKAKIGKIVSKAFVVLMGAAYFAWVIYLLWMYSILSNIQNLPAIFCLAALPAMVCSLLMRRLEFSLVLGVATLLVASIGFLLFDSQIWPKAGGRWLNDEQFQTGSKIAVAWALVGMVIVPGLARFTTLGRKNLKSPPSSMDQRGLRLSHSMQIFLTVACLVPAIPMLASARMDERLTFLGFDFYWWFVGMSAAIYAFVWCIYNQRNVAKIVRESRLLKGVTDSIKPNPEYDSPMALLFFHAGCWFSWSWFIFVLSNSADLYIAPRSLLILLFLVVPGIVALVLIAQETFIAPVMGDSASYFSPKPKNIRARKKIRAAGTRLFEKLHQQPEYDRVIVVAHSLGSAVAFDVLAEFWYTRNSQMTGKSQSKLTRKLDAVDKAASALHKTFNETVKESRNGEVKTWLDEKLIDKYQHAQTEYFCELSKLEMTDPHNQRKEKLWLISDFITIGSPLTYARLLTTASDQEFEAKLRMRDISACPPKPYGNCYNDPESAFFYPKALTPDAHGPHHAAVFAPTRWTNIYFNTPGLVTGDAIGGPVDDRISLGVKEVMLTEIPEKISFAHSEYWLWYFNSERRKINLPAWSQNVEDCEVLASQKIPQHIQKLRVAMELDWDSKSQRRVI